MPIKLGLTARLFRGKKKKRKKALKLGIIRISEEMVARFGSWRWDLAQACTPASWEVRDRPLVAGPCLSWVASPEVSQTPATVLGALFKPTLGAFALFLNGAAMGLFSSSIIALSCPVPTEVLGAAAAQAWPWRAPTAACVRVSSRLQLLFVWRMLMMIQLQHWLYSLL